MHYLLYVDESGDAGVDLDKPSVSDYFALTGIRMNMDEWRSNFEIYTKMRKRLNREYGLKYYQQLHARELVGNKKPYQYGKWSKTHRYEIFQIALESLLDMHDITIYNVYLKKRDQQIKKSCDCLNCDIQDLAWNRLLTRFHITLDKGKNQKEIGMVIPDKTREKKLTSLMRKWRRTNPQYNPFNKSQDNVVLSRIIEDPFFKRQQDAPFLQLADLACYAMVMRESIYRRSKGRNRYARFGPGGEKLFHVFRKLLETSAATNDEDGIVRR